MSLVALNEKGNSGIEVYDFNCGGFALGTFDWYEPYSYEDVAWSDNLTLNEALEILAGEIMEDFPWLIRVSSPEQVPNETKVIGFRFDTDGTDWEDPEQFIKDFHFAVRYEGIWYDKPGPNEIREMNISDIRMPWIYQDFYYDSDIAWFIDPTNDLFHDYQEED